MKSTRPDNTLATVRDEIERQPSELKAFLSSWSYGRARRGSIFVGAGDSLAVSTCASYLSRSDLRALDPYVLHESPEISRGKDVYFVSVSGRTRANIAAARKISRYCGTSIAITANEESPLASQVDKVVKIPYMGPPRLPGTLSYSLSLLAALLLALPAVHCDFRGAFDKSRRSSKEFSISHSGMTYMLGNGAAYGVSLYAAAKLSELIGARSHPQFLEEFSHMELFSLSKLDSVNIFDAFDSQKLGKKLHHSMRTAGYACTVLGAWGRNDVERMFHSVFLSQLAVLRESIRRGLTRPRLQLEAKLLRTSDLMIYEPDDS